MVCSADGCNFVRIIFPEGTVGQSDEVILVKELDMAVQVSCHPILAFYCPSRCILLSVGVVTIDA